MGITLKRNAVWYRPYFAEVNGKEYRVDNIHFYKDGKILVSNCTGWLEKECGDIESVELPTGKIINRRKEKFDGEVFAITHKEEYVKDTVVDIYIPSDMLDIHFAEHRIMYEQLRAVYQGKHGIFITDYIKNLDTHKTEIEKEYENLYKQADRFKLTNCEKDNGENLLKSLKAMEKLVEDWINENKRVKSLTVEEALRQEQQEVLL